jgi:hypothetical protein
MRVGLPALAFVATCAGPCTAVADEPVPGTELAMRLGFGLPLGDVDSHHALAGPGNDPLGQTIGSMVPIWIDGGYRWSPRWFVGGFLAFAPGFLGSALSSACAARSIDCSVFDLRAGADVQYHQAPRKRVDPWLGAGLGYEWLTIGLSQGANPLWASGFELVNLQAGLDVAVWDRVHIGPFVALTIAEYFWNDGLPFSKPFSDPAPHEWVVLGVRYTVDLSPRTADRPKPDWGE